MADKTLGKLLDLISTSASLDARLAAVKVSGLIGSAQDRGLVHALLALVSDSDLDLRLSAIEALGQLGAEAAMLRLLGTLHVPQGHQADALFWSRLGQGVPGDVRIAALQALGNQATPISEGRLQQLLVCASDTDFQIVAHALMILRSVPA